MGLGLLNFALTSESGWHTRVYSGADSESQRVSPSQNVARSSKSHVPPLPFCLGRAGGFFGSWSW